MSLREKLDEFRAGMAKRVPAEKLQVMGAAIEVLRQSGQRERALRVGERMPAFSLPNQDGVSITLSSLLARGPLVVNVYRGVWCPLCNIELAALNDALPDIRASGADLVAIAPHLSAHAADNRRKLGLHFDLLADAGNTWARKLDLVFELPPELRTIYQGLGVDLPKFNGDTSWTLPMPARYVVGTDGVIRDADVNPDYGVRPEPADTIAALRALRHAA